MRKLRQNTQYIANFSRAICKNLHQPKKIYTGISVGSVTNMRYAYLVNFSYLMSFNEKLQMFFFSFSANDIFTPRAWEGFDRVKYAVSSFPHFSLHFSPTHNWVTGGPTGWIWGRNHGNRLFVGPWSVTENDVDANLPNCQTESGVRANFSPTAAWPLGNFGKES